MCYDELVHPADRPLILAALRKRLRVQKRLNQRCGRVISRHRVRNAAGHYSVHVSLITLTRDASNRLAFLFGVDYLAPAEVDASAQELEKWVQELQRPMQAFDAREATASLRRRSDRADDPFFRTWRSAGFIISPSLFRMVRTEDGNVVELSKKQARFISLLLGSHDEAGIPTYVPRPMTRRRVFGAASESRLYENDIDRLVQFFRSHLGRDAIRTKRSHGHILRFRPEPCDEEMARDIVVQAR